MADKETTPLPDTKILEEAAADLDRLNEQRKAADDPSKPRVMGGQARAAAILLSKTPFPERDMDLIGPTAYGTTTAGLEITGSVGSQEFFLDAAKLEFLPVTKPGGNLPAKRLYVIKALHKDGTLVQLPAELRHNNNAGGDPQDMIGLRRYQRKGILLLMNFDTGIPWYCAAWDCWAQSESGVVHAGFCTGRHAQHTLPNRFKDSGEIIQSIFGSETTTTSVWGI